VISSALMIGISTSAYAAFTSRATNGSALALSPGALKITGEATSNALSPLNLYSSRR
jgi:hypothetical protein